jgi:hypothetical protein
MFDKDVGVNWHLRLRLKIEELQERVDYLNMKNRLLRNKIKNMKTIILGPPAIVTGKH